MLNLDGQKLRQTFLKSWLRPLYLIQIYFVRSEISNLTSGNFNDITVMLN